MTAPTQSPLTPQQALAEQGPRAYARVMQSGGQPFRRVLAYLCGLPSGTLAAMCEALAAVAGEGKRQ